MTRGRATPRRSWRIHPLEFGLDRVAVADLDALAQELLPLLPPGTGTWDGRSRGPDAAIWSLLDRPAVLVLEPPLVWNLPRLPQGLPWLLQGGPQVIADYIRGYWASLGAGRPLLGLVPAGSDAQTLVSSFCEETWSWPQAQVSPPHGGPRLTPRYPQWGPWDGLLTAFDQCPEAAWLVVGRDRPHLEETLVQLLTRRDPTGYATVIRTPEGQPDPLLALYEPKSRQGLWRSWALGDASPVDFLQGPGVLTL